MPNDDRIMSIDDCRILLSRLSSFCYLERLGYIVGRFYVFWATSRKQEKFPSFKSVFDMDLPSKINEILLLSSSSESLVKLIWREVQFPISEWMDEVGSDLMPTRRGTESSKNNYPDRQEKYENDAAFLPCDVGRSNHSRVDSQASLDALHSLSVLSINNDEDLCALLPMIDVFLPNGRQKSAPGIPTFRLCISSNQPD